MWMPILAQDTPARRPRPVRPDPLAAAGSAHTLLAEPRTYQVLPRNLSGEVHRPTRFLQKHAHECLCGDENAIDTSCGEFGVALQMGNSTSWLRS